MTSPAAAAPASRDTSCLPQRHRAQVGMVGPVSTLVMAVLLLGEPFTAALAAGTPLVLPGIGLLPRAHGRAAAPAR